MPSSRTPQKTIVIPREAALGLAYILSHLLDKVGAYHALLADVGVDPGDDDRTDRLLIAGQRIVHQLRSLDGDE